MASTPMDLDTLDSSPANGTPSTSLNITRTLGASLSSTAAIPDVISCFRPTKLFKRDDIKDGRPQPYILSLDYDDPGELLMTSESDETIQIYKVRDGRHDKQLLSKKYGVKLAKFTRNSSSIIYASTKQNDAIRYLTTHDNAFIRYFEGHEGAVTCLAMHPGTDDFISCGKDNTVRLWNAGTKNATGLLHLNTPYLAAYDPSGQVFAVGSPTSGQVLLYDQRNFDKAPFAQFDILEACGAVDASYVLKGWTKLEFANDGRSVLLGTRGAGHFLLDSFNGSLKAYLRKPESRTSRLAAGEEFTMNGGWNGTNVEGSGDCCFTPDGRYVIGGTKKGVVVWDTLSQPEEKKMLDPMHNLEDTREAAVVCFNPRFNFFATADQEVVFWVPDPHA
ncbi:WD repeat-containing protein [Biscogniauxia mediterranea]|nr:WD repeat-containing protein [Biscogniauxia mediterranea]KAI1640926.1 WD repeat-containing protein [Biscogniauxia mediterranea]